MTTEELKKLMQLLSKYIDYVEDAYGYMSDEINNSRNTYNDVWYDYTQSINHE